MPNGGQLNDVRWPNILPPNHEPSTGDNLPSEGQEFTHDALSASKGDLYHPLIAKLPQLQTASQRASIHFVRAEALNSLPTPLPRCQDLPADVFGVPMKNDMVIAVSHAWPHQAHPDAKGLKKTELQDLLSSHITQMGNVFLFFDFLSISQRPFLLGQKARTAKEERQFVEALQLMHHVYFLADAVLHLDLDEQAHDIPDEGCDYYLNALELHGANYCKVGDWIMIDPVYQQTLNCPMQWAPFDRIIVINDASVDSIDTVHDFVSDPGMKMCQVKLKRYPFGRPNRTSPHLRGWIFLERFMSMVKCAMLDSSQFDDVVFCTCDIIKDQIREGAQRLRKAAQENEALEPASGCKAGVESSLATVLDAFFDELAGKHFSGTSADADKQAQAVKVLPSDISASPVCHIPSSDSEVVAAIMCDFTQRLRHYWHEEVAHQLERSGFLLPFHTAVASALKAGKTYIMTWDCFSDKYKKNLVAASSQCPWALALLITLPPCLVLAVLAFPFERPDSGWKVQYMFWMYGNPLLMFFCFYVFPLFLGAATGVQRCRLQGLQIFLWLSLNALLDTLTIFIVAKKLNRFPVPLCRLIGVQIGMFTFPLLWLCVPRHQRRDKGFQKRAFYSWAAFETMMGTFGVIFPVLNAILLQINTFWQALLALVYLATKVLFEQFAVMLSKRLGADSMPFFVFMATLAYEVNMCLSFAGGFHWGIFAELICFDAVENAFHIWHLWRQRYSHRDKDPSSWARQQYMIAIVMLREFIEILVPAQFYFILTVLHRVQPLLNTIVCSQRDLEFQRMQHLLMLDCGIELLIGSASVVALWWRGFSPLLVLKGLLTICFAIFLACAVCVYMYALALQHSHMGMDLTLQFLWMRNEASWECGIRWQVPAPLNNVSVTEAWSFSNTGYVQVR